MLTKDELTQYLATELSKPDFISEDIITKIGGEIGERDDQIIGYEQEITVFERENYPEKYSELAEKYQRLVQRYNDNFNAAVVEPETAVKDININSENITLSDIIKERG